MSYRVLIAGGGVAALETLLALRRLAPERVEVELLAPQPEFSFRPLSVIEPFGGEPPFSADLSAIAADQGARFRRDALAGIDTEARVARTAAGDELSYDALVVACGARTREALSGAITFMGAAGRERVAALLRRVEAGQVGEVVFALPVGAGWPLPLYELALLTAAHLERVRRPATLSFVTPEAAPLEIFGERASAAVASLLSDHAITLLTGVEPRKVREGHLELSHGGRIAADAVVALPWLEGPAIDGLPRAESGFVPVDERGRVLGADGVYAAGDATTIPIKQGGLAAQQADAVAELVAAEAGADVDPVSGPPVLRGLLLTGDRPRFMRAELHAAGIDGSVASDDALWWPPSKIAGRYLAPYLAQLAGSGPAPPAPTQAETVEVELSPAAEVAR